jgi:hypothetical protein
MLEIETLPSVLVHTSVHSSAKAHKVRVPMIMACGEAAEALDTFDPAVGFRSCRKERKSSQRRWGLGTAFGSGFGGLSSCKPRTWQRTI